MYLYYLFIVIIVNVLLVFLLLQFIIIPYLVKAGDLPNNTSLDLYVGSAAGIFSPITSLFRYKFATQDVQQQKRAVVYL